MTITIDPTFSVYKLVNRASKAENVISHRRSMSVMSYEIENATRLHHAENRIFASFQNMSRFVPQMKRYTEIAKYAEHVYVIGVPDMVLPKIDNITYVYLNETDQLAKEWFVVSHGPKFHSMLATEELSRITDPDESRVFRGLWTFDLDMVRIVEEWLSSAVDAKPLSIDPSQYSSQSQAEIVVAIMGRLLARREFVEPNPTPADNIVNSQIQTALKTTVQPTMQDYGLTMPTEEREVIVFFSDIRDFSSLAETMPVRELVENVINPYLDTVSHAVQKHGGKVDKLLGDGILAIFGLSGQISESVQHALNAAQESLSVLSQKDPSFPIGIGIAKGSVMLGEVGTGAMRTQTAIGDTVNIAERLSSLGYNGIWFTESVYQDITAPVGIQSVGNITLKGKKHPEAVYRYLVS